MYSSALGSPAPGTWVLYSPVLDSLDLGRWATYPPAAGRWALCSPVLDSLAPGTWDTYSLALDSLGLRTRARRSPAP